MALELVVCGAAGRMGSLLVRLIAAERDLVLAGAVEAPGHPALGRDAGEVAGSGKASVRIVGELAPLADPRRVILDFTAPAAAVEHVRVAAERGAAIVVGTTGLSPAQQSEIRSLAARTRCLVAPNMSLGVNVLLRLVAEATRMLGPAFDAEIVELHHRHKKDAPSGTALALGRAVAAARGQALDEQAIFGRHGQTGERPAGQIGILALRAGDAVGTHTVLFGGAGERLELTHRAESRECLARGAIRAARWLAGQPPGLWSMEDVLRSQG